jgi:hypothetical protein
MLDTWTNGATKSVIVDFVDRVTTDGGPDFVEPAARVAVFDNDGTAGIRLHRRRGAGVGPGRPVGLDRCQHQE